MEDPHHVPRWKTCWPSESSILSGGRRSLRFAWASAKFRRFLFAPCASGRWTAGLSAGHRAKESGSPPRASGFRHFCWRFSSLSSTTDFCSGRSSACLRASRPSFWPPFRPSWRFLKFSFCAPNNLLAACRGASRGNRGRCCAHEPVALSGQPRNWAERRSTRPAPSRSSSAPSAGRWHRRWRASCRFPRRR